MAAAGGRITAGVGANLIGQHSHDRNQEATVYVGNLDLQVQAHERPFPAARSASCNDTARLTVLGWRRWRRSWCGSCLCKWGQ